jgi:hypothetical protein
MISVVSMPRAARGNAEVDVVELALDDIQRHSLAGHLDGMGVAQLVRREASAHAGLCCDATQVVARGAAVQGLRRV